MKTEMWQKTATGLVWLALGFSVVAWGMHLRASQQSARQMAAPAPAVKVGAQVDFNAMVRALNAGAAAAVVAQAPAPALMSGRFQVKGVALAGQASVALLSIDGQAAKPYLLGAEVIDGWVLRSATSQKVQLSKSQHEPPIELQVPPPAF